MELGLMRSATATFSHFEQPQQDTKSCQYYNNGSQNADLMELDFYPAKTVRRSSFAHGKNEFEMFMFLPYELKFHVFRFVSYKDVCALQASCRLLCQIATENALWREITMTHFVIDPEVMIDYGRDIKDWKENFKVQDSLYKKGSIMSEKVSNAISKPKPRFAQTGCVVDGSVYYIGGQMSDGRSDEIYSFDAKHSVFEKVQISNYKGGDASSSSMAASDIQTDIADDCRNFRGLDGKVPAFARHQAVLINKKIYVFGGYDYTYFYNLAVFDPKQRTWTYPQVKGDLPAPRSNHSSAVVGSKFYIFGGSIGDNVDRYTVTNDFYSFDTETLTWAKISSQDEPSQRVGHVMTAVGSYIYLFGGGVWGKLTGWTQQYNDLYIFDTIEAKWHLVPLKNEDKPPVCTYPYIFTLGNNVLIFGGAAIMGSTVTNKLYSWDVLRRKWTELVIEGEAISSRSIGSANLVGNEVLIWGGYCGGILPEDNDFFRLKVNLKGCNDGSYAIGWGSS